MNWISLAQFDSGKDVVVDMQFIVACAFIPAHQAKVFEFQQGSEDMSKPAVWCSVDACSASAINITSISNEW